MNKLTEKQQSEINKLSATADGDIDFSDIPEISNWSGAERGHFSSVKTGNQQSIQLNDNVYRFLAERARKKGVGVDELANELLLKDIEVAKSLAL